MLYKSEMENSPFGFITINRELICLKPSRDTFWFLVPYSFAEIVCLYFHLKEINLCQQQT